MRKIFLIISVNILLMFGFFICRLNAQDQPPAGVPAEATISMDFKDASLKDILKVFSMQSGLNFIASEAVQDRKVTLYLEKVPLSQAMDKIFSANNLSYDLDTNANIFSVKEWGKMETQTITKVFYLKNASVSTSSLKSELSKTMSTVSESSGSAPTGGKWKVDEESGITSIVRKLLTPGGVGSVIEDFRTNSLIVTDTPMKIEAISKVIASLDIRVTQVMLEVEMLDVSKVVIDKLGFNFGDSPFTAVLTGATASTGFPFGSWSKIFDATRGSIAINTDTNTYQMQLDFIRTQSDTKFLARPKLLTLNNETAEISITTDEVVGKTETPGTQTSAPTVVFERSTALTLTRDQGTGIVLRITPQIDSDTNEVTMVLNPKFSVSKISPLSNDTNLASDIEVRSTKSIIKIKDGETVVLGGLIHQDKEVALRKLPVLGDIPIVGALFRHKEQTKGLEREMIVFITPHIIRDKNDVKFAQVQNIQLPVREQATVFGSTRDSIINSNMNKFDKKH
ncbi:MAG: secretin N-terminal domain-containing protein [Candidatus Omnitrophota bacterium]